MATRKVTKKSPKKKKTSSISKVKRKAAFRTYKDAIQYVFGKTDYEKQQTLRYNVRR
jgi:hypothetical protein